MIEYSWYAFVLLGLWGSFFVLFSGVNKAWRYVEHGCDLHFSKGKLKADKLNPFNIVGKETLVLWENIFELEMLNFGKLRLIIG